MKAWITSGGIEIMHKYVDFLAESEIVRNSDFFL